MLATRTHAALLSAVYVVEAEKYEEIKTIGGAPRPATPALGERKEQLWCRVKNIPTRTSSRLCGHLGSLSLRHTLGVPQAGL